MPVIYPRPPGRSVESLRAELEASRRAIAHALAALRDSEAPRGYPNTPGARKPLLRLPDALKRRINRCKP